MKRIHLFEFEDFPWCPDWIRRHITHFIVAMHRILGTPALMAPLLVRALKKSKEKVVVDLCSGGGGPMPLLADLLRQDPEVGAFSVVLTDLYPNKEAAGEIARIAPEMRYEATPVDAGNVGAHLNGVRTMVCSMHHMRPETAKKILADAFAKKQPIVVFEISSNFGPAVLWWLSMPFAFLTALFVTPVVRPLSFRQIFFTYVIPLLPLVIAWDGTVSNARVYTTDDMNELLQDLRSDDYRWETGITGKNRVPGGMAYLIGHPV